jgi:hypothetical protein
MEEAGGTGGNGRRRKAESRRRASACFLPVCRLNLFQRQDNAFSFSNHCCTMFCFCNLLHVPFLHGHPPSDVSLPLLSLILQALLLLYSLPVWLTSLLLLH